MSKNHPIEPCWSRGEARCVRGSRCFLPWVPRNCCSPLFVNPFPYPWTHFWWLPVPQFVSAVPTVGYLGCALDSDLKAEPRSRETLLYLTLVGLVQANCPQHCHGFLEEKLSGHIPLGHIRHQTPKSFPWASSLHLLIRWSTKRKGQTEPGRKRFLEQRGRCGDHPVQHSCFTNLEILAGKRWGW